MALIQCSECGAPISDRAQACPKCGAPVDRKVKCADCGADIPASAAACPVCGCPNGARQEHSAYGAQTGYSTFTAGPEDREKRIHRFLVQNKKFFFPNDLMELKDRLYTLSDSQLERIEYLELKDPIVLFVISICVGYLGIDRFMLGDTSCGIGKLLLTLLCGVGFVWWIVDLFLIMDKTKEYNAALVQQALNL